MLAGTLRLLWILIRIMSVLLVLKVTAGIVWVYKDYVPPNFNSDFLQGRETYFFAGYAWAFYAHIVVGPLTLLLGGFLLCRSLRKRFPATHRVVGRLQVGLVLLVLTPSGLWMACYSRDGWVSGLSFGALALATGGCVVAGWVSAMHRRFDSHQRWMERCFVLLCSAVVLRVMVSFAVVMKLNVLWFDTMASILCWTIPLLAYELARSRSFNHMHRRLLVD